LLLQQDADLAFSTWHSQPSDVSLLYTRDAKLWPRHCLTLQSLAQAERRKQAILRKKIADDSKGDERAKESGDKQARTQASNMKLFLRQRAAIARILYRHPLDQAPYRIPLDMSVAAPLADKARLPPQLIHVDRRPYVDDAFLDLAVRMDHGPRACCETMNHLHFLDWHQCPLLHFLGLAAVPDTDLPPPASLGLLDEPAQLNWLALLIGTLLGLLCFLLACIVAARRLAAMANKHEKNLKVKLQKRRQYLRLQKKLLILHYLNQQHANLADAVSSGRISGNATPEMPPFPFSKEDLASAAFHVAFSTELEESGEEGELDDFSSSFYNVPSDLDAPVAPTPLMPHVHAAAGTSTLPLPFLPQMLENRHDKSGPTTRSAASSAAVAGAAYFTDSFPSSQHVLGGGGLNGTAQYADDILHESDTTESSYLSDADSGYDYYIN
jgi:hypothetical protein